MLSPGTDCYNKGSTSQPLTVRQDEVSFYFNPHEPPSAALILITTFLRLKNAHFSAAGKVRKNEAVVSGATVPGGQDMQNSAVWGRRREGIS